MNGGSISSVRSRATTRLREGSCATEDLWRSAARRSRSCSIISQDTGSARRAGRSDGYDQFWFGPAAAWGCVGFPSSYYIFELQIPNSFLMLVVPEHTRDAFSNNNSQGQRHSRPGLVPAGTGEATQRPTQRKPSLDPHDCGCTQPPRLVPPPAPLPRCHVRYPPSR